ncbi:uncharacterized protein LOC106151397 [Lingula anatina]|uniref:Uncharacterized protein LOC106151397 n=1 Tax=Lingula anatina TaxID=7574 RepID=A0A2R2MTN1_LINAN|nr:uncharacterized protein LOC106151397 [Lingula anatina]|eukprot:XP_023933606.1 uncharacterized protein LOC106151397 [Lingula anatina]
MRLSAPLLVLSAVVLLTGTVVHGCRQFCKLQDCTADGHSNQLLTVINDATVMYCMQRCGQDESCQSFSYKESGSKCKLYSVDVLAGGACRKYHRKYAIYSTAACKISAVSPVTVGYAAQGNFYIEYRKLDD